MYLTLKFPSYSVAHYQFLDRLIISMDVVFWCPKSCFIELKLLLSSDVVWRITNRHLWLSFPLLSRKLYITDIPNLEECWNTFQCILSKRDAGTPKNYDLHNKRHYFIACMYVCTMYVEVYSISLLTS